jgi:hypothetical protein
MLLDESYSHFPCTLGITWHLKQNKHKGDKIYSVITIVLELERTYFESEI